MDNALTLKEVAERLNVHYMTIYNKRKLIGFRLPNSRIWRVWESTLAKLSANEVNLSRQKLLPDDKELLCQSSNATTNGMFNSQRQAVNELGLLLGQRASKKRRNFTIV